MVPMSKPSIAEMMPLTGFSPMSQPMELSARSIRAAISAGPKRRPNLAREGPMATRISIPMRPPMKDAVIEANSAGPGRPFFAIG